MENQRLILFIALSFVSLMLWDAWQKDYAPPPEIVVVQDAVERGSPIQIDDLPGVGGDDIALLDGAPSVDVAPLRSELNSLSRIHVVTDVLDIEIDTLGGDIRYAGLRDYTVEVNGESEPFSLMRETLPGLFVAQSGLNSAGKIKPSHHIRYQSRQDQYQLTAGAGTLKVPLYWTSPEGLEVIKTYTFYEGEYLIDVEHRVLNETGTTWKGNQYSQLQRSEPDTSADSRFIYIYTGGVIYSPEDKYEKIAFDDMVEKNLSKTVANGWVAMVQHYFFSAWIPDKNEKNLFYTKALNNPRYIIGSVGPSQKIEDGGEFSFKRKLYIGPKDQDKLVTIAEGLELTVDYGVFTVIAQPIFWLLKNIHSMVGNWGWSIILLTVLIKGIFYKLSETSYRSMANMRRITPRLKALKDRFGDDKQGMHKAMMDIYKTEKINPLGGCLPILVQIPVFISLYWVLLEAVELRQAPFIFWISDLATKDPYYVLPLLMGISMFIQQKLNPPPMDPIQAKVMMLLPFIFTVFFAFFPSGLVLYWVVNNVLSISQQWVITRKVGTGSHSLTS
ncbi:MAG: membrane protein insertase YidC [Gammaproteobacteria bacterium]|nr:membrane protein insertase YidC [Gammaproteobacteria bacterium]